MNMLTALPSVTIITSAIQVNNRIHEYNYNYLYIFDSIRITKHLITIELLL